MLLYTDVKLFAEYIGLVAEAPLRCLIVYGDEYCVFFFRKSGVVCTILARSG